MKIDRGQTKYSLKLHDGIGQIDLNELQAIVDRYKLQASMLPTDGKLNQIQPHQHQLRLSNQIRESSLSL